MATLILAPLACGEEQDPPELPDNGDDPIGLGARTSESDIDDFDVVEADPGNYRSLRGRLERVSVGAAIFSHCPSPVYAAD